MGFSVINHPSLGYPHFQETSRLPIFWWFKEWVNRPACPGWSTHCYGLPSYCGLRCSMIQAALCKSFLRWRGDFWIVSIHTGKIRETIRKSTRHGGLEPGTSSLNDGIFHSYPAKHFRFSWGGSFFWTKPARFTQGNGKQHLRSEPKSIPQLRHIFPIIS